MNIFEKSLQFSHFIAVSMAVVLVCGISSANAASNGCDVEDNTYVNAELALCNTHVYNIGDVTNPKTDSDKQLMRDVVALKTTVMTQQMYKQYEYMDAMIRRFKTQLKKAVLTTSLQAAGAADENGNTGGYSSSGGGTGAYSSNGKNLIGTENCRYKSDHESAITCLQNNVTQVRNAVAAGNIGEARRQLIDDLDTAVTFGFISGEGVAATDNTKAYPDNCTKDKTKTTSPKLASNRNSVNNCIDDFWVKLMTAKSNLNKKSNANPFAQLMGGQQ